MLQYLIKFSISLAVLYIFYIAVLRPLTFYTWNRFYLLCYSLLSFVIPFVNINPWVMKEGVHDNGLVNIIPVIDTYAGPAFNSALNNNIISAPALWQRITWNQWLIILFCLGAAIVLLRAFIQYASLLRIRGKAVLLNTNDEVQLYQTSAPVSPFSFGNAIYFNSSLHSEEELQRIIQHEFVHVKQKHSADILLGELLCVLNWFNPFAWFIRHAIRQNLEFIADNDVLGNGIDRKEYQYLLLKVVGISQYRIANNFNFSNLKKRITMMNKMKSARLHLAKFMFILPLLAVLLLAFRNTKKNSPDEPFVFTGIVYDAKTSQPLANVSINEKYSGMSVVTDANGFFKIKIPLRKDSVFRVSCAYTTAGYEISGYNDMSFVPETGKKYAELCLVSLRKEGDPAYEGVVANKHYQIPVDNQNMLVPDPDYTFVKSKFNKKTTEITGEDKIDQLVKHSKKPIWIIDGIPYAIGNGGRAWLDKSESEASPGFKVWVDGKLMNMEEANALVNRFEVKGLGAYSADHALKKFGIKENVLLLYWKTRPAYNGIINDTIPLLPQPVNKKGYSVTISDNNGDYIIVIRDKDRKIIKIATLADWNNDKKNNENMYGELPAPPPPVPGPPPPPPPGINDSRLPANVDVVVTRRDTNKKNGNNLFTATVTLKDGSKENYDLNDPNDKATYLRKYGEIPAIVHPVPSNPGKNPPVITIDSVMGHDVPLNTDASQREITVSGKPSLKGFANKQNAPLFIIDDKEMPAGFDANQLDPNSIRAITVLKDKDAMDKYGEKGKNGVLLITTKEKPWEGSSATAKQGSEITVVGYKSKNAVQNNSSSAFPKASGNVITVQGYKSKNAGSIQSFPDSALIIIDGVEMPAGSKSNLKVEEIETINVIRPAQAAAVYGDKGRRGAILIQTKKNHRAKDNSVTISSDTIKPYATHFNQFTVNGSMKGEGNESYIDGSFSFENPADAPLVIVDGYEMGGINSFKSKKGRYRFLTLTAKEGIDKYGSKAKYGALEITSLHAEKSKGA